jgi:hypothetical protein
MAGDLHPTSEPYAGEEDPTARMLDVAQRRILYEVCFTLTTKERARLLKLQAAWLALDLDSQVLLEALAVRLKPAIT